MKRASVLLAAICILLAHPCRADLPAGFTWVNLEADKTVLPAVRHALHDNSITAIREVGVEDGLALVMTASRESGAPTPDYDLWSIYNISLSTGQSRKLVSGYGVKLMDWVGTNNSELAITYYSCWECEAASLFTTLRFKKGVGWRARWTNKTKDQNYPQPGAVIFFGDAGEPYDDDDVDQIFGVVSEAKGGFAVGSWFHSHNTKTGKIEEDVERYSIDPVSGEDHVEKLSGQAALIWERKICSQSNILIQPTIGQDSKSCRSVLKTASVHPAVSK